MRNRHRLMHDLGFLTDPQPAGRLSGTEGARRTAHYLKAELDALGFDSALQPVDIPAARLISTPRLVVGAQAFSPRRDFAELTALSAGGRVNRQLLVVREDDLLVKERFDLADSIRNIFNSVCCFFAGFALLPLGMAFPSRRKK